MTTITRYRCSVAEIDVYPNEPVAVATAIFEIVRATSSFTSVRIANVYGECYVPNNDSGNIHSPSFPVSQVTGPFELPDPADANTCSVLLVSYAPSRARILVDQIFTEEDE